MTRKYWGHRLTRKEKKKRQERRQKEMEQRGEIMPGRASAYQGVVRGKKVRTDEERADCLLKGLQSDIEKFYSQVKLRGGLGQKKSYEYQGRDILGPGLFYDDAAQRPVAGTDRYEADEFLSKTGMDPRNFLSRRHRRGMAYRLSKAVTIISEMPEPDASTLSEYRGVVAGLKQSGLYEALLKRRKELAGQMADFEKKISNMQVDTGPGADSYSDEQDLTYRDDGPPRGHRVRTVWH